MRGVLSWLPFDDPLFPRVCIFLWGALLIFGATYAPIRDGVPSAFGVFILGAIGCVGAYCLFVAIRWSNKFQRRFALENMRLLGRREVVLLVAVGVFAIPVVLVLRKYLGPVPKAGVR